MTWREGGTWTEDATKRVMALPARRGAPRMTEFIGGAWWPERRTWGLSFPDAAGRVRALATGGGGNRGPVDAMA